MPWLRPTMLPSAAQASTDLGKQPAICSDQFLAMATVICVPLTTVSRSFSKEPAQTFLACTSVALKFVKSGSRTRKQMRRTRIGDEAFLLRLSWGNAGAAGFLGARWSGRRLFLRHCGEDTAGGYCLVMLVTAGRGEIS